MGRSLIHCKWKKWCRIQTSKSLPMFQINFLSNSNSLKKLSGNEMACGMFISVGIVWGKCVLHSTIKGLKLKFKESTLKPGRNYLEIKCFFFYVRVFLYPETPFLKDFCCSVLQRRQHLLMSGICPLIYRLVGQQNEHQGSLCSKEISLYTQKLKDNVSSHKCCFVLKKKVHNIRSLIIWTWVLTTIWSDSISVKTV